MKKVLIVVIIAMASAAAALAQAERLGTQQWKLVQLDGVNVQASSRAYLELDSNQARFSGHTGCNRMFGSVSVQGRRIDFSGVGTTKMACLEPRVRRVETGFVRALENVDRFRRIGNALDLYDRNRIVARLRAVSKQDPVDDNNNGRVGLEDRKWMLEAIRGVAIPVAGRGAFVIFDEAKGSAGGNSSCNVFGGTYTKNVSRLSITDVVSTMRACIEDARMTVERDFLDGLRQANRYDVARGKLMLYRNERLLLTLNGERK